MAKASPEELEYLISRLRDNLGLSKGQQDLRSSGSRSYKNSFVDDFTDELDNNHFGNNMNHDLNSSID